MKASTYKAFKKLNERIDLLTIMVAALVDESSDKAAAKALAVQVNAKAQALRDALPKA